MDKDKARELLVKASNWIEVTVARAEPIGCCGIGKLTEPVCGIGKSDPPLHTGDPPPRYTSHHTPTATFGVLNRPECTFLSITGVPLILSPLLVRDNAIRDAFRLRNWWNRVQSCSKEPKFSAPAASWTKTGDGVSFRRPRAGSRSTTDHRIRVSWSVANAFLPKRLGKYYGLPQTPGSNFTIDNT